MIRKILIHTLPLLDPTITRRVAGDHAYRLIGKINDPRKDYHLDDWQEIGQYVSGCTTLGEKLHAIYHLNFSLVNFGLMPEKLVPQFSTKAKYLTLDSDALFDQLCIHGFIPVGSKTKDLLPNCRHYWQTHLSIPAILYLPLQGPIPLNKWFFNFLVYMDGVGTSMSIYKWIVQLIVIPLIVQTQATHHPCATRTTRSTITAATADKLASIMPDDGSAPDGHRT